MKLAVLRRVVTMEEVFEVSVVDEQDEDDDEDEDVVSCKKASFPHSLNSSRRPQIRLTQQPQTLVKMADAALAATATKDNSDSASPCQLCGCVPASRKTKPPAAAGATEAAAAATAAAAAAAAARDEELVNVEKVSSSVDPEESDQTACSSPATSESDFGREQFVASESLVAQESRGADDSAYAQVFVAEQSNGDPLETHKVTSENVEEINEEAPVAAVTDPQNDGEKSQQQAPTAPSMHDSPPPQPLPQSPPQSPPLGAVQAAPSSSPSGPQVRSPAASVLNNNKRTLSVFSLTNEAVRASKKRKKGYNGTIVPWQTRQKIRLLTSQGPRTVQVLQHKAEECPSGKYKCPVPGCPLSEKSRVYVAKHFDRDHPDYVSWREIFVSNNGPDYVKVQDDEEEEQGDRAAVSASETNNSDVPSTHEDQNDECSEETQKDEAVSDPPVSITSSTELSWSSVGQKPLCSTISREVPAVSAFSTVGPATTTGQNSSPLQALASLVDNPQEPTNEAPLRPVPVMPVQAYDNSTQQCPATQADTSFPVAAPSQPDSDTLVPLSLFPISQNAGQMVLQHAQSVSNQGVTIQLPVSPQVQQTEVAPQCQKYKIMQVVVPKRIADQALGVIPKQVPVQQQQPLFQVPGGQRMMLVGQQLQAPLPYLMPSGSSSSIMPNHIGVPQQQQSLMPGPGVSFVSMPQQLPQLPANNSIPSPGFQPSAVIMHSSPNLRQPVAAVVSPPGCLQFSLPEPQQVQQPQLLQQQQQAHPPQGAVLVPIFPVQ